MKLTRKHTHTHTPFQSITIVNLLPLKTKRNCLTNEIWNETAIGKSPSGVLEEGLPIRPKISLVINSGIDVVIVSHIKC